MIMLGQTLTESPGGDDQMENHAQNDVSESMAPKSLQSLQSSPPTKQVQGVATERPRERKVITINNEEYEEMSVHTDDEEWEWQSEHEHEDVPEQEMEMQEMQEIQQEMEHHQHQQHVHHQQHQHHHPQQPHKQLHYRDLQQADSIEELLGSSLESLVGDDDDDEVGDDDDFHGPTINKARPPPLGWQPQRPGAPPPPPPMGYNNNNSAANHHHAEAILMRLEQDSPRTRRRKMMEADELVSEDEEDDIDSENGSQHYEEEYDESPHSSDDYDDITDEEDDYDDEDEDDDAWSGEYVYEEIELPDHITPIQKNWMNSWFCSTHRRRMEQISEGEEEDETDSDSEGSISLKDGKSSKGNDLDKSWGSLDSHMRSWHSQRSQRSYAPHTYQSSMSPPPLLRDIKALLPAKSPTRPSLPKVATRKADQPPPKQAETLVRNKEAVEEQELNDSLRLGDRTAYLKAKRKAAAAGLKKPRSTRKKKDKETKDAKDAKDGKSKEKTKTKKSRLTKVRPDRSLETEGAATTTEGATPAAAAAAAIVTPESTQDATATPEATTSALSPPPPPPPPDNDTDTNSQNDTNVVSDSKSKSKRKSTSLKLDSSSTHEGSKSTRTMEGTDAETSTRSKSKSKRNSKGKSKTGSSSTNTSTDTKEVEKSDRSTSKSTRRLKAAALEETSAEEADSASNRRRKLKDTNNADSTTSSSTSGNTSNIVSPSKVKKRSKTKPATETDLDGSAKNAKLPLLLEDETTDGQQDAINATTDSASKDKGSSKSPVSLDDFISKDDSNRQSPDQDIESFQKPDSKRSRRGKHSSSTLASIPDDDCSKASRADTIKTSEPKRSKSPKARKSDTTKESASLQQQLPSNLTTPLETAVDPSKPSSEKSPLSLHLTTTDDSSVQQDTEEASITSTSKSPRTRAKAKAKLPSSSSATSTTLDSNDTTTKKPSSRKSLAKSSTSKKNEDDENSSVKSRSTSARSKSAGSSRSRRKSDEKSHSKHKTVASTDEEVASPKPSSSTKRGGKRNSSHSIHSLDAQRRSDPNLVTSTADDDSSSSDLPSVLTRKSQSMVDLSKFKSSSLSMSPSPSPSKSTTNSAWPKGETETVFLQLDITNDGKADAKELSTTRPVKPSLLSQMSWNEKMSQRNDKMSPRPGTAKVAQSMRNLNVTGATPTEANPPLEEPDTPSSSNRKAGFFRFLISPLRRATSFHERPKRNLKEQLMRPSLTSSKEQDKKSNALHQVSTVTFTDGTDGKTSNRSITPITSNADATSSKENTTTKKENGRGEDLIKPTTEERVNSDSIRPATLSQQKDDSAGTIKTSMMSLSLDEESSLNNDGRTGSEANVDPGTEITTTTTEVDGGDPDSGSTTTTTKTTTSHNDPFASVSGKVHVKPNSFRVSTSNWKNIFTEDPGAVATRRTSA